MVHHCKRISLIYLASVWGGALFISVLDNRYTVGASGGVYGLAFSHLATITLNWNEMDRKCCGLFSLSMYFVYDAGFALFNGLIRNNKNSHVKYFKIQNHHQNQCFKLYFNQYNRSATYVIWVGQ